MLSYFFTLKIMCEYINENQCLITKEICPFVYFCNKQLKYLPLKSMPKRCKVIMNKKKNIPEGYNAIEFVRGNYLYVKIDDYSVVKIKNPYDYTPDYVKVKKYKGEWKIIKENKGSKK